MWRDLPNYNPVAVANAAPGIDHAAAALDAFEGFSTPPPQDQKADGEDEDEEGEEAPVRVPRGG